MSFVNRFTAGLDRDSFRLFGWDVAAGWRYLRSGWGEALHWRALSWLSPSLPVRVIHPDGTQSVRQGLSARPAASDAKARYTAVELPEEMVLRRELVLPALASDELRQAVEMDARTSSPFGQDELAWGYVTQPVDGGRVRVSAALTSRRLVEQRLTDMRPAPGAATVEVWAGGSTPVMIPGFGERARLTHQRRLRTTALVLLVLALVQSAALALTPTLQHRERAIEAQLSTDELRRSVQAQAAAREEYARIVDQLRKLGEASQRQHDVVAVLDRVTRLLPDDTFLISLEIESDTVRISGQSDNASQLMQVLGTDPTFRDVKAPAGFSRAGARGKEGFAIEFGLVAKPGAK